MERSKTPIEKNKLKPWQLKLHEVIFEANTTAGKAFDIILLIAILLSITVVMVESVDSIRTEYGTLINVTEWVLTILFTIEYVLRLICIGRPIRYVFSFYGIVDLLSVLPTYAALFITTKGSLAILRSFRLIRIFRVLKLARFISEGEVILTALKKSRHKILVFLLSIVIIVTIMGSIMYMIEPAENGFTSIPRSIYWAIVTLTTVGFGDIAPSTPLGQAFASIIMLLGYAIIAVPTGIVTNELNQAYKKKNNLSPEVCMNCSKEGHDENAKFCDQCGAEL